MSLHTLIPDKFLNKAPHALSWIAQAVFAAALPEIYEKMPKQVVTSYLGLTPENFERLKFVVPALVATVGCYKTEILSHIVHSTSIPDNRLKCCLGN